MIHNSMFCILYQMLARYKKWSHFWTPLPPQNKKFNKNAVNSSYQNATFRPLEHTVWQTIYFTLKEFHVEQPLPESFTDVCSRHDATNPTYSPTQAMYYVPNLYPAEVWLYYSQTHIALISHVHTHTHTWLQGESVVSIKINASVTQANVTA